MKKFRSLCEKRKTECSFFLFFLLETLKSFVLNEKFKVQMTTIRASFRKTSAFFINFRKRAEETPPPLSSLVARLYVNPTKDK